MSNSKLINYTTQDFQTEKDLELNDYRWNQIKDKYLPKLRKWSFKNGFHENLE